jgi:hypothetical protein
MKCLYAHGLLEIAIGAPQAARSRLEEALVIGVRLGEGLFRPHIERTLAKLG